MPFQIVRNDIVNMRVDAIVNTANPEPVVGSGVDTAIHKKAGPRLMMARQKIGPIPVGDAAITPGYDLDAAYVIHAAGPVWQGGGYGEETLLRRTYDRALELAVENGCRSIAFPLLSAGNYGFPKTLAMQTAVSAFSSFLMAHDMLIYLVVFSQDVVTLSERLFASVASYIDEHYVRAKIREEYGPADGPRTRFARHMSPESVPRPMPLRDKYAVPGTQSVSSAAGSRDLEALLRAADAGFSETLLQLIDKTGKKDSEIYTKANVSRQLFSKIRKNPHYQPTKATAIAFAIALELDLEQTRDLIGRAGYALTRSSKFDVIIMYFISQKNYNMFDINAALFAFDQSLLGA